MISSIEIISFCNVASEMDMECIFDFATDANVPGARVDYITSEEIGRVAKPIGAIPPDFYKDGIVVVWKGHFTNQTQLAEAVIKELSEDI